MPVELTELRDRNDGAPGSAARIAALGGIFRYPVVRASRRQGIEEAVVEDREGARLRFAVSFLVLARL
jgi:hypothetical protein